MATLNLAAVILVYYLVMFKMSVSADDCAESSLTAMPVSFCPKTAEEWTEAALRKNCSNIYQTCSSFEYHCVINAWMNETVEVCAPKRVIVGKKCAEYNYGGNRIQSHLTANCKECLGVYRSDESFKYQECYEHVYKKQVVSSSILNTSSSEEFLILKSIISIATVTYTLRLIPNTTEIDQVKKIKPSMLFFLSTAAVFVVILTILLSCLTFRRHKHIPELRSFF